VLAALPPLAADPSASRTVAGPRAAEGPAATPAGQAAVVDAGTFTVFQGATRLGREEFAIRRLPPPDGGFVATGTVVYADRRLIPLLRTDASGAPLRYQLEVERGARRQELLTLEISRQRARVHIQSLRGESDRELLVPAKVRLLETDLFAHYYFIARPPAAGMSPEDAPGVGASGAPIALLLPSSGDVEPATVRMVAPRETVQIGGQPVSAVHIQITVLGPGGPAGATGAGGTMGEPGRTEPRGGAQRALAPGAQSGNGGNGGNGGRRVTGEPLAGPEDVRDVWTDDTGRVLRVTLPARGISAIRDEIPH